MSDGDGWRAGDSNFPRGWTEHPLQLALPIYQDGHQLMRAIITAPNEFNLRVADVEALGLMLGLVARLTPEELDVLLNAVLLRRTER